MGDLSALASLVCVLTILSPFWHPQHDCNSNCKLVRVDKVMRFQTLRDIPKGSEITTFYANDYCTWMNDLFLADLRVVHHSPIFLSSHILIVPLLSWQGQRRMPL